MEWNSRKRHFSHELNLYLHVVFSIVLKVSPQNTVFITRNSQAKMALRLRSRCSESSVWTTTVNSRFKNHYFYCLNIVSACVNIHITQLIDGVLLNGDVRFNISWRSFIMHGWHHIIIKIFSWISHLKSFSRAVNVQKSKF